MKQPKATKEASLGAVQHVGECGLRSRKRGVMCMTEDSDAECEAHTVPGKDVYKKRLSPPPILVSIILIKHHHEYAFQPIVATNTRLQSNIAIEVNVSTQLSQLKWIPRPLPHRY